MQEQDFSTRIAVQLAKLENSMKYIKHSVGEIIQKLEMLPYQQFDHSHFYK